LRYKSPFGISAAFSKCRNKPVLSALLPWIGIDSLNDAAGLAVDVMAAAHPQQGPAAALNDARQQA